MSRNSPKGELHRDGLLCLMMTDQIKMWRRARKRVKVMLKPIKRKPMLKGTQPEKKSTKEKKSNKLPPDAYKDEIVPIELEVDETRKFVLSVKRGGELGLPMCDIRQFQTTELYTGYTKKGINFPIELLPDLIELLQEVYTESEKKGLLD